jgi:peptidoglycan hydrolase CwlO-like protein
VTLTVAALAFGLSAPQVANSVPSQSLEDQRDQVRAERARVAAQIDTSEASLAEVDAALTLIEENLHAQQAALTRIEGEVAQAEKDIADAEAAIVRLDEEIALLRDEMRRRAVAAYVSPAADDVLSVLETNDFTTAATRKFYIELRSQGDADVADRLQGATADIAHEREKAQEARQVAEAKRQEQADRTAAVDAARADQQRLADNMQATIDTQIARSLDLAATDRELSAKIAEEQAALAARLAAERAAREEAARQASRRASQSSGGGGSSGGGAPLPALSGGGGSSSGNGGVAVCSVPNISGGVNCQIKDRVLSMLNAARADGVNLTGSGYRDASRQIALRKSHCGSSHYAIYQMSASSCRPPTAKPGSSQHEIGLAIDFSNCSRGSASFGWLKANAASFGFYNLPSESWHWSTSGR